MKLSLKPVRASRARGFRGLLEALWRLSIGTDVVPHIVFCFHMCNHLPEIMKNGDAGIFPVYYSLKAAVEFWQPANNTIGVVSVCSFARSVHSGRAVSVFIHRQCVNKKSKTST